MSMFTSAPPQQQTASAANSGQEERLRQAEAQSAKLEKEREGLLAEHQSKEKELQGLRGE